MSVVERARGIDVSHHRPVTDWKKILEVGISFFGAKCSEGNTVSDKTFRAHREGARQHPFELVIYYHFARPGNPQRQAERFMDIVGPLRANERLCLDLETDSSLSWIDTFYRTLMGAVCVDRRPLIYTSNRIWKEIGNPAWDLASEVDLWVPRYHSDGVEPEMPKPWATLGWRIWQYSDALVCPGVGLCDGNYFNGDAAALREYAKLRPIFP